MCSNVLNITVAIMTVHAGVTITTAAFWTQMRRERNHGALSFRVDVHRPNRAFATAT